YLLNIEPLQALQMTELANTLGVTHSTISRLCKNRYIETPIGTIPLRKLFEVGTIKGKNTTHTKSYALAVLEEIIKTENILHPFSDKKIQHELELRGIFISIRTVGKFRDVLQIPSAKFRKDSPGFIKSHERSAEILGKILNKPWSAKKSTKNIQDILKRLGLFSTLRQISRARMALSK
ncbi:MAG: hypothetical protein KDD56_10045, partial [Bdellovibrionales bacterium]|nr:hypothetical protein [Bdellovibrionales bacterium]